MGTLKNVLLWGFPVFFLNFWVVDRLRAYFFLTEEQGLQGFIDAVLPANTSASITEGFRVNAVHPLYSDRSTAIRVHIVLGGVIAVSMCLQLMPFIRAKAIGLHRTLGGLTYTLLPLFAAEIAYTLFVKGMVGMGKAMVIGNTISLISVLLGGLLGYRAIKRGDVAGHQFWMTLVAAAVYINPSQRFFWSVLAKSQILGKPETWEEFREGAAAMSEWVAIVVNLSVWAYYNRKRLISTLMEVREKKHA